MDTQEKPDPADLDRIMTLIGGEIPDTPEAWARVAMRCLDQGMVSVGVQNMVEDTLRREGVIVEARPT